MAKTKKTMPCSFLFARRKKSRRREATLLLVIKARSGLTTEALQQSEEILRRRRNVKFGDPNNFDIKTADKFIEQFDSITAMVGLIAIAISSLGLLVGGIGVMNIMLVSVTERTKEIGVRKALGARRKRYCRQFLFEAMTLTFLGGILGVMLAVGISRLSCCWFLPYRHQFPPGQSFPDSLSPLASACSSACGRLAKPLVSIQSSACATNKELNLAYHAIT